jgi:hypothetical protein
VSVSRSAAAGAEAFSVAEILATLTRSRLLDLCRLFGCHAYVNGGGKERVVERLAAQMEGRLPTLLRELGRDELRAICRLTGLDASARARAELLARILEAAGIDPKEASVRPQPISAADLPEKGQIVLARRRQWRSTTSFSARAMSRPS